MKIFRSGACAPIHMLLPLPGPTFGFLTVVATAGACGDAMLLSRRKYRTTYDDNHELDVALDVTAQAVRGFRQGQPPLSGPAPSERHST